MVISLHLSKTLIVAFSNHVDIITIHEVSHEYIWLRYLNQRICENCGITSNRDIPTILYEEKVACITQFKEGFIKGRQNQALSPKLFFSNDLQKECGINIQRIQ